MLDSLKTLNHLRNVANGRTIVPIFTDRVPEWSPNLMAGCFSGVMRGKAVLVSPHMKPRTDNISSVVLAVIEAIIQVNGSELLFLAANDDTDYCGAFCVNSPLF